MVRSGLISGWNIAVLTTTDSSKTKGATMKKYFTIFALYIAFFTPPPSYALFGMGDIVFDPGQTLTSIIEFARDTGVDVKTAYNEVEQQLYQYKDALMQVQAAVADAEKLMRLGMQIQRLTEANDYAGLARIADDYSITLQEIELAKWLSLNWDDFSVAQFKKVLDMLTAGEAIGIYGSEIDDLFNRKYTGYQDYVESTYDTAMWGEKYNQWSLINRDTIKGALNTIGINAEGIADEEDLLNKLKEKAATAEGAMQINQVAVEMSAVGVGQMQDLKELLMAQTQMQAAFYASQQDKEDIQNAQMQSHNMRELEDGIVPITNDAVWNDNAFRLEVR
jgi:hypothetical protein